MSKMKDDIRPLGSKQNWARTHGTYIAGQAAIDGADQVAAAAELKWGSGRLRLLVDTALREKFDRQRYLYNAAIWHGDLEQVRRESERMRNAWLALDQAAELAGASVLSPAVWEVTLANGTVAALVRSSEEAHAVIRQGRSLVVYTLAEIGRLIESYYSTVDVKQVFPGSIVQQVRTEIGDPLDGIRDGDHLDSPLDDLVYDLN